MVENIRFRTILGRALSVLLLYTTRVSSIFTFKIAQHKGEGLAVQRQEKVDPMFHDFFIWSSFLRKGHFLWSVDECLMLQQLYGS